MGDAEGTRSPGIPDDKTKEPSQLDLEIAPLVDDGEEFGLPNAEVLVARPQMVGEDLGAASSNGIIINDISNTNKEDKTIDASNVDISETQSPEDDESKKDVDTSKAVTFAEDIEVFDCKATTPITVSLDTPVHSIDPLLEVGIAPKENQNTIHEQTFTEEGKYENTELCPSSSNDKVDIDRNQIPSDHPMVMATRPCLLNLDNKQVAILVTPAEEIAPHHHENQTGMLNESAPSAEVESEHKVFSVTAVDESELNIVDEDKDSDSQLLLPPNDQEEQGHTPDDNGSMDMGLSTKSGQSNDRSAQDTIGPLENPAFLKTLHYSVSHQYDDDEQYGVQSYLDITSLMARAPVDPDLDGGWAWVVLVAAFLVLSILGATTLLSGILMKSFMEEIESDLTKASWIGSVYVAIMCLTGPLVGFVMKRLGARLTVSLAGIVIFIGFFGASFSTSLLQLILTHGIIAGMGAGFAINPTFVIVGQYFNHLRGLACGLLATGAGVGFLAGGTIISQLLSTYGLSGTYLLWSAVVLHITALGLLMLPSPEERMRLAEQTFSINQRKTMSSQQEMTSGHNSLMSGLNSLYSGTDQNSVLSGLDRFGHNRLLRRYSSKYSTGETEVPLLRSVLHKEMSRSSHSVSTSKSQNRSQTQVSPLPQRCTAANDARRLNVSLEGQKLGLTPEGGDMNNPPSPSQSILTNSFPVSTTARLARSTSRIASSYSIANNFQSPSITSPSQILPSSPTSTRASFTKSHRPRLLSTGSQPHSYYHSLSHISQGLSVREGQSDLDNQSLASVLVSTLRPQDALTPRYRLGSRSISTMMGSIASFPTALAIITDDITRWDVAGSTISEAKTFKQYLIVVLDSMRLLRNKAFLVFISTCFLWALGESPVMIYLPSYAISRGTSPMQASSLYTALGIGSIVGRFLTGLVASDRNIGPSLLHIGCLGVAGAVITLSPLFTETFFQQMLFAGLLGIYTGSLVPLMSLMTVDLLGVGELAIGFGFICMFQGFGYLIGPPVSGVIVNSIGFTKSFVFSGCTLLSASLLGLLLPLFIKRDDDDDDQNSLDDLEKALQQVSESNSDDDINEEDEEDEEERDDKLKPMETQEKMTELNCVILPVDAQNKYFEDGPARILDHVDEKLEPIPEVA